MSKVNHKLSLAEKRRRRVRAKVRGTSARPRVTVFRSNRNLAVQVINDEVGQTLAAVRTLGKQTKFTGTKTEKARQVAVALAAELKKQNISKLVFDRGSYRYHGRVRAVAEALREQGIDV